MEQAVHGVSIATQTERLASYAQALDFGACETVVDAGESGANMRRPGIGKLLERIRRGEIARVVCVKLDRISRSAADLDQLVRLCVKHDVALVSLSEHVDTSTAAGRMFISLVGVFAQFERERIGERTSEALQHLRRSRKAYAPTPYGWKRVGDSLVREDREQRALKRMRAMRNGGVSLSAIARDLNARNIPPRRASAWDHSAVRSVLTSRMASEAVAA
jgi:site-specific DNA recombinase